MERDPAAFNVLGGQISPTAVLRVLVERGWVPLRQVSVLLGYQSPRGIYSRQRGNDPIECVQIGGIKRVYLDVIIRELEKQAEGRDEDKAASASTMLTFLSAAKVQYERKFTDDGFRRM